MDSAKYYALLDSLHESAKYWEAPATRFQDAFALIYGLQRSDFSDALGSRYDGPRELYSRAQATENEKQYQQLWRA